jgi:hypothetical protein
MELPIAHEALSRWVMALVVGVKTLEKIVAAEKELAQSLRVIEPGEISISPAAMSSLESTLKDVAVVTRSSKKDSKWCHGKPVEESSVGRVRWL